MNKIVAGTLAGLTATAPMTAAMVAMHKALPAHERYPLPAPRAPGRPVAKGITWGLIVWATSYLGLLPATGLHEPATRHPRERNLLMILAHVVWGGALGLLLS